VSVADPTVLQSAVDRLAKLGGEFRTLRPQPEAVAAVRVAANRLQAALARERGTDQPVLTVAFAGCTGAGKSTLINGLARSRITRVIGRAATTRQAHVYHHRDLRLAGLPNELANSAVMVSHDRPELFAKVLIDTPDLDTAVVANRATTKAILKAATLVLYVFTPEKYAEERVWSVIEQERRFSASAAVLNKADRLSPDELAQVTDDLRGLFVANGAADVRIFRTVAVRHQPPADDAGGGIVGDDASGTPTPPASLASSLSPAAGRFPSDDFEALRTFIERELRLADIMRLARRQRKAAVAALSTAVDGVIPQDTLTRVEAAAAAGRSALGDASTKIVDYWRPTFLAAEDAIVPAAKRRYHERFRGPMRAWFAMWDGAALAAAKFAGRPADTLDLSAIKTSLEAGRQNVEDGLQAVSQTVQDALHAGRLPVGRWQAVVAGRSPAQQVVNETGQAVEGVCRQQATACSPTQERMARVMSWVALAIVAFVIVFGAWRFAYDLAVGRYDQSVLLVINVMGLLVLSMLGLHLVAGMTGPGGQSAPTEATGRAAVAAALDRILAGWLTTYRDELAADVEAVRGQLTTIERTLAAEDAELGEGEAAGAGAAGVGAAGGGGGLIAALLADGGSGLGDVPVLANAPALVAGGDIAGVDGGRPRVALIAPAGWDAERTAGPRPTEFAAPRAEPELAEPEAAEPNRPAGQRIAVTPATSTVTEVVRDSAAAAPAAVVSPLDVSQPPQFRAAGATATGPAVEPAAAEPTVAAGVPSVPLRTTSPAEPSRPSTAEPVPSGAVDTDAGRPAAGNGSVGPAPTSSPRTPPPEGAVPAGPPGPRKSLSDYLKDVKR
jgi:GTP-binding protein EngB required for normal cell division